MSDRNTPFTVKEMIETLQTMPADATVEFECPKRLAGDSDRVEGSRVFVTVVRETFYNSVDNKWVTIS